MRRRTLLLGAGGLVLAGGRAVRAEGAPRRVGLVSTGQPRASPVNAAFDTRMRELGHVDGGDVAILFRTAEGHADRLPGIYAELVEQQPAAIVAVGPEASLRAAHKATTAIPIVMVAVDYDPLTLGYVSNLARPQGNITGVFAEQIDLAAKRLEILAQLLPAVRKVGVLADEFSADQLKAVAAEAPRLGLTVEVAEFGKPPYDFAPAMASLHERGAGAALILMSPVFYRQREALAHSLMQARLPSSFGLREWVAAGGLMSYGANLGSMMRRAADYTDKILKGAKPGDLPIEQPTKFAMVVNLKAANALGVTIPPAILARADEVIE